MKTIELMVDPVIGIHFTNITLNEIKKHRIKHGE